MLTNIGYKSKDIYVFMLYNWEIPFKEMEKKELNVGNGKFKLLIVDIDH
jgi:hypothetical protein